MSNSAAESKRGADPQYAVDPAPPKTGYLGYPINVITRHKASQIVQDLMSGLGLNTTQLAVVIGVSASLVSRWRLDRAKIGKKGRAKLRAFAEYVNNNGELGPHHIQKLTSTYGEKWSQLGSLDPEIIRAAIRSHNERLAAAKPAQEMDIGISQDDAQVWVDGPRAVAKLRKSLTYHLPMGIVCFIAGAVAAIGISIAMGGFLWR